MQFERQLLLQLYDCDIGAMSIVWVVDIIFARNPNLLNLEQISCPENCLILSSAN